MTTSTTRNSCKRYDLPPDLECVLDHHDVMVSSLHQPSHIAPLWSAQLFDRGETQFRSLGQGYTREEAVINALRPVLGKKQDKLFWRLRSRFDVKPALLDRMNALGREMDNLTETIRGAR